MMALQLLPILQVVIILCSPSMAYPVYGTKRYGRAQNWNHQPVYRSQRYPINYYELYPSSQYYPEEYYYPQEFLYYPRTSKYEVYQAVLPYYYQERPYSRPNYYYDDPELDLQEEIQEAEREQREENQPIGHEIMYENEDQDSLNDANAAFLQNLIMSQMYNNKGTYEPYGEYDDEGWRYKEDEEVRELKELARNGDNRFIKNDDVVPDSIHWFQKNSNSNSNQHIKGKKQKVKETKRNERKEIVKATEVPIQVAKEEKKSGKGQKEIVMMRPATPVRNPFSGPVMEMLSKNDRKRTPSVYDTIKHMLNMEKDLENKQEVRPQMKKRIITSEDSLIHQLSVLKKH